MADGGCYVIRRALGTGQGHAMMLRGSLEQRLIHPVFQPEPAPIEKLTRNLKEAFDPHGILNPNRMYDGI